VNALRLALGLFTVVPSGFAGEPDRATVRRALLLGPLVGAVLGVLGAGVLLAVAAATRVWSADRPAAAPLAALLAAGLTIATLQILTGGLHLDGAADTADGLAARGDAERTVAVMRDSAVGAAGSTAVTLLLLVDVAALALAEVNGHGVAAVIVAAVTGRLAAVWATRCRAARAEGLGWWVAGTVRGPAAFAVSVVWILLAGGVAVLAAGLRSALLPFALAAVPLGVMAGLAAIIPVRRRIGGITGDLLGAAVEVSTAVALIVLALAP
jgi:adenosylcobinamide-GDP ribazoletransferase